MLRKISVIGLLTLMVLLKGITWAGTAIPVSPGNEGGSVLIGQDCPTFSWSFADGAEAYRIEVYEQQTTDLLEYEAANVIARPIRVWEIAAPALAWTPSANECLTGGMKYVWYIKGANNKGEGQWSRGIGFQVEAAALTTEQTNAVQEMIRLYLTSEEGRTVLSNALKSSATPGVTFAPSNNPSGKREKGYVSQAAIVPTAAPGGGLIIDQNGYVGIGTTSPTVMLDVAGSVNAGPATFGDNATNGTGVQGTANVGSNAWGVYGVSGDGIGVMGRSVSASGFAGRFENLGGGKAIGAMVNSTEVMSVDAAGVHAGPGMTPTPIAHGVFAGSDGHRISGSSNIDCVWNATWSWYQCSITGEYYYYTSYTVNVTPLSQAVPAAGSSGGLLLVTLYDFSGAKIQPVNGFSVSIFKQ